MQKKSLIYSLAFSFLIGFNTAHAEDKNPTREFIVRLGYFYEQMGEQSKECYQNNNEDGCKKLKKLKKAFKEETKNNVTNPGDIKYALFMEFAAGAHVNRATLYNVDETYILDAYKDTISKESYDSLIKIKEKLDCHNKECFVNKNYEICADVFGHHENVNEFDAYMKNLHSTNQAEFAQIIQILTHMASEALINTKGRCNETHQQKLEFLKEINKKYPTDNVEMLIHDLEKFIEHEKNNK